MLQTAAMSGENVSGFIMQIDWMRPSWDLFIILFFLIGSLLYGLSMGRDRVIGILVSIYMALAVVNSAPFIQDWAQKGIADAGVQNAFTLQLTSFIGSFLILFFLLSRSALLRTVASRKKDGVWWQTVIFSILHVGLLISITMSFIPKESLEVLEEGTRQAFTSETAQFLWIVGPIVAMIVFGERKAKRRKRSSSDEDEE